MAGRLCKRCDSSGSIEGPEQGWYELECPVCRGTGVESDTSANARPDTAPPLPNWPE